MADLTKALNYTLKWEGGWSDDPDDPGGATMYGITFEEARQFGIKTKDELRNIKPEQVEAIYRAGYWRFGGLASQQAATKLFDIAVNMGLKTSVRMTQGVLNELGAALQEDGCWGPKTEACVNATEPGKLVALLCEVSAQHYRDIVAHRPTSAKFLHGWLRRAAGVPDE